MTTKYQHYLRAKEPVHLKRMVRLDRQLTERGIRSYRGYVSRGHYGTALLNFDHGSIAISLLGNLYWRPAQ